MTLAPARLDPKAANALYHDAAARAYDGKWAISFDDRCLRYVRERAERMLPGRSYGRVLEIGAGTGFFMLNLWRAGLVAEAHAIDISTGMLAVCAENARTIGCDVRLRVADAERLPFDNGVFDLVVGHAILHHLPSPGAAIEEAYRVLVPGGDLLIAGEPTRRGDRRAKRVGRTVGATVRGAARRSRRCDRRRGRGPTPNRNASSGSSNGTSICTRSIRMRWGPCSPWRGSAASGWRPRS